MGYFSLDSLRKRENKFAQACIWLLIEKNDTRQQVLLKNLFKTYYKTIKTVIYIAFINDFAIEHGKHIIFKY